MTTTEDRPTRLPAVGAEAVQSPRPTPRRRRPRHPLPVWRHGPGHDAGAVGVLPRSVAYPLAALGGLVLDLAFPGAGVWVLAFPAVAMMLLAVRGQRFWVAFGLGYVFGAAFFLVDVDWAAKYLGPVPWLALALFEALFPALGGAAMALAYRWVPRAVPTVLGRVLLTPAVVAALWTGREWLGGNYPYNGFSWGRVALSQSQSPFAPLVAWLGVLGLTFVLVFMVAALVALAVEVGVRPFVRAVLAVGVVVVVLAVPAWPATTSGMVRVESVQGDGPAGYFDGAQPGEVLSSQLDATDTSAKGVDMVVWPEASAEFDPRRSPGVAAALDALSTATHAPIVAGAITENARGQYHNTSFVWQAGKGWLGSYDKAHPVPFGEYVPDRWFYSKLAPSLIGLIGRDYTPGTKPNTVSVAGVRVGLAICFDIVDDRLTDEMTAAHAQLILAQTNNADFDGTDENLQQLAIARMRAIETGRSLVNISTVGASAVVDPSGRTIDSVPAYTATSMVTDVPLGTSTTPATVIGTGLTTVVVIGGVLVLLGAAPWRRRRT
ncbi:apolipoprotein N-acyltransferase [Curtobacterium sp. MCBD17_028]|uniref:apolipoprotein N-acyltransferase n=1 Tax=Curtobacterium sp. MCBD17_028 TaxID=2175670 RepID=UPI000DA7D710|nr:apolipoprotein N-acyltransferase [Curtobacterium sp. MCBD17_028]PZE28742.1 apolipoprotein N-acyltransferase [Curtobacterium sp. MCBD17_028]